MLFDLFKKHNVMDYLQKEKLEKIWDAQPEDSSNANIDVSKAQKTTYPDQQNYFFTTERIYTLGFRLISLLFLAIFLFIVALYYGFINP